MRIEECIEQTEIINCTLSFFSLYKSHFCPIWYSLGLIFCDLEGIASGPVSDPTAGHMHPFRDLALMIDRRPKTYPWQQQEALKMHLETVKSYPPQKPRGGG